MQKNISPYLKISGNGTKKSQKGILYVVSSPIGNLSDITIRALEVLKQADHILCEDTRITLKLLNHFGIQKPLLTIFGPKEKKEIPKILALLQKGECLALLSDAGTPALSDPGASIIKKAKESLIPVVPIPGPSAILCALSVCGFAEKNFLFLGFLHRKSGKIKKELLEAKKFNVPVVFFESPFRILKTLSLVAETWGKETLTFIGREMTKKFEEILEGTLGEMVEKLQGREILGEFTVILSPKIALGHAKQGGPAAMFGLQEPN